jgi:AraC-like DNA-binding protein
MLYLSGIVITFFLLLLLISKKGKSTADIILACWLAVIGFHLFTFYLFIAGRAYDYPLLLGVHIPFPLFHGPFLYLYASAVTDRLNISNGKYLLHFIPALLCYIYLFDYFLLPDDEKILVFKNRGAGYEVFMALNNAAISISGIVYCVLTLRLHRLHRRSILDQFSYTEKINLNWIQYLTMGLALIWVFVILSKDNLIFGTAVLFVLFIGYFGIRQVGIFNPGNRPQVRRSKNHRENPTEYESVMDIIMSDEISSNKTGVFGSEISGAPSIEIKERKKYSRSGLSEEAASELHQNLNNIIHSEKIFTNSKLTLTELAKRLGTHPNYLSQVINEKEGKNFYDYINTLRTEEFIRIVTVPGNRKFTLLSLAYECGFNSKSTFNKYFRKVTGLSPSQFLQHDTEEVA